MVRPTNFFFSKRTAKGVSDEQIGDSDSRLAVETPDFAVEKMRMVLVTMRTILTVTNSPPAPRIRDG